MLAIYLLSLILTANPVTACAAQFGAAAELQPPVVNKFFGLFDQLRTAAASSSHGPVQRVTFQLSDGEINEYMRYSLKATHRPGIDSVTVKVFDHNYISTFTMVNFDAVESWKPGTIPAVLRPVLNGKKSV